MRLRSPSLRAGANAVESALVYPLVFFIILSLIVGAMGIFRYQEMAAISRDAARFASTHGAQFRKDAGWPRGNPGTAETTPNCPLNTSASPYNAFPWNTLLWFRTHPTGAAPADLSTDPWADYVYDAAVRGKTVLLDPAVLQMWVGYEPVVNQPTLPDNFPGARVCVCCQYQVFPEAFIWWTPSATMITVSTTAMPITN